MTIYTKILVICAIFSNIWLAYGHCFIFRIQNFDYIINSENKCNIFVCHDHHTMGTKEQNEAQLQNFLQHLKKNPNKKRLIITESKCFYGIDCLQLNDLEMIQDAQKKLLFCEKALSYNESPQDSKFTTFISWHLPLAICLEKEDLSQTSLHTVDSRLLINNVRDHLILNKSLDDQIFLTMLDQIKIELQQINNHLNHALFNNIPNVFKQALLNCEKDYQELINQPTKNFSNEEIKNFIKNFIYTLKNKKYSGCFFFAEPIVSLEIMEQIFIQEDLSEIFVFCGARHALMLEKILAQQNLIETNYQGYLFEEIDNCSNEGEILTELTTIFDKL